MNRALWKKLVGSAVLAGAFFAPAAHAQSAATLSLVATPDPARVGTPVAVDVAIAGVVDLYAFQFSLAFDPTLLQVSSIGEGSFLSGAGTTFFDGGTIDNALGKISFSFDTLIGAIAGKSGSGVLEHVVFSPIAAGSSTLAFSDTQFLNSAFNDVAVSATNRDLRIVAVTAVPEPETVALMGLGLAAIAAIRRRRPA